MIPKTQTIKHDPSLTFEIIAKLQNQLSSLSAHFPQKTQQLLQQLTDLQSSDHANDLPSLLPIVKLYCDGCHHERLSADAAKRFLGFFDEIVKDLEELSLNIETYKTPISGAIDAYTLNHTCRLINILQNFINQLQQAPKKLVGFHQTELNQHKRKELSLAMGLKTMLEEIRSQIGSPESAPKGLVISFMMTLCDAKANCETIYGTIEANQQMFNFINLEIAEIQHLYPDLAEAGEDLQRAIANYSVKN